MPARFSDELGKPDPVCSRDSENDLGTSAVLVRPDGIVAWASDHDPDPEAFEQAASHWFGTPE
jgi:hypothetical protein